MHASESPPPSSAPTGPHHRPLLRRSRRTHPLIWLAAILCSLFAVAVIITGISVFIIYLIFEPRIPYISVPYAKLNKFEFDQSGQMSTDATVTVVAENHNMRAHARFSDFELYFMFAGIPLAELTADPFDVPKNNSVTLAYVVQSSTIPLGPETAEMASAALQQDRVSFGLSGKARVRWKIGVLASVRFWTHLSCNLVFFYSNGSSIGLDCISKSR